MWAYVITIERSQISINPNSKMTASISTGNCSRYTNNCWRWSTKCIGKKISVHIEHIKTKFVKIPNLHNSSIKYNKTNGTTFIINTNTDCQHIEGLELIFITIYNPINLNWNSKCYASRCSSTAIYFLFHGSTALVDLDLLTNEV
jgi:hypothetical protein